MKKILNLLPLTIILLLLNSCNSNDEDFIFDDFNGKYKIISIKSSVPVDLRNNGIKSTDYLHEIMSDYILHDGQVINYGYNPEELQNFAEARPLDYHSNYTPLLDINFPVQRIDSVFMGNDTFIKINMEYSNIITGFKYKIIDDDVIIETDPFNQFDFYNIRNFSINRIDINSFKINFNFDVYDFSVDDWVDTELEAIYHKVGQ